MKQIIIATLACVVSTVTFSAATSSSPLHSLGSAFKTNKHIDNPIIINSDDITMGYAGEDVANHITMPVQLVS